MSGYAVGSMGRAWPAPGTGYLQSQHRDMQMSAPVLVGAHPHHPRHSHVRLRGSDGRNGASAGCASRRPGRAYADMRMSLAGQVRTPAAPRATFACSAAPLRTDQQCATEAPTRRGRLD